MTTGPATDRALPLTGRPASDVLCWRSGRAVTVGRFLAKAAALAARLPDRAHAVNLCTDRYRALLGFAAALIRGQVMLLCADQTPQRLRALVERYPDAHAIADGPVDTALPVLRPLLPMIGTRWGRIVAVSSVSGIMGNRGQTNYAAAKAGLIGAVKSVSLEYASRGVTANAVAPGVIESPAVAAALTREQIARIVPARRAGRPEKVADLVGFLASDRAAYISGQVISINGGMA